MKEKAAEILGQALVGTRTLKLTFKRTAPAIVFRHLDSMWDRGLLFLSSGNRVRLKMLLAKGANWGGDEKRVLELTLTVEFGEQSRGWFIRQVSDGLDDIQAV